MVQEVVGGRYALIAHLGGGAVSDVSLAKMTVALEAKPDLDRILVVKRLKFGADAEPKIVGQFAAEASLATRLNHPNIVQAFEAGEDDNGPFLVLEYLQGITLARLRSRAQRRAGGLPRAIVLHIVTELATGLAYAHALEDEAGKSLKVIHRDLSPENIVVTYDGTTKIVDFGVAPVAASSEARAGGMKGNLAYVAPEQARAGVTLDARADVFALGVIMWELLAGRRMWEGLSEADVLSRLADNITLPSVRTFAPDVSPELDAICAQALAKIRDDRFDSAFEMRAAIDKASTAPELRTTSREVGDLVTSLFDDERQKMNAIVAEAVAGPAGTTRSVPSVAPPPPTNAFADTDSNPSLAVAEVAVTPVPPGPVTPRAETLDEDAWDTLKEDAPAAPHPPASAPATAPPAPTSAPAAAPSTPESTASSPQLPIDTSPRVEILRIEHGPSRDRRFAYAMGAAIAVAFASVLVVAMTRKDEPKTDDGVAARRRLPTSEPVVTAAAPPVSAEVEPEEITVEIRVTPPTAHIFVDGVKVANNPHRVKVVPGKFPHEIRAEAEGFSPYTTTIPFDRTRTLDVALPPKPRFVAPTPALKPSAEKSGDNPY